MPTTDQNAAVAGAIDAIRNAEILLTQQIRVATDTMIAIKLANEYSNLDSCLSTLLHAQNCVDDATFAVAASSIQSLAGGLKADEATINAIIKDVHRRRCREIYRTGAPVHREAVARHDLAATTRKSPYCWDRG